MITHKKIRIGCGQGFWGDWLEAPKKLAQEGNLNYLILDYLAEVTMSVLAKQKEKNANFGYGKDFPALILDLADSIYNKGLKVIANAGGLNPKMCAMSCIEGLKAKFGSEQPLPKIAVILGDNLMPEFDQLLDKGVNFNHFENGESINLIKDQIKSVNAYIGCESIVAAMQAGAQIIITGRVADPSMCLAPLIHEFSWKKDDWDKLAAGILAGHIIECGAQSTGGNFSENWQNVPDLWNIGYPIVECSDDGTFIVTKSKDSGGLVSTSTVTEQLVYEIGDPQNYITPDVIVDLSNVALTQQGENHVLVKGVKGKKRPDTLKISATYHSGYGAEGTLILVGPKTKLKADLCKEILLKRFDLLKLDFEEILFENLGTFACIPGMAEKFSQFDPPEVVFRVAAKSKNKKTIERFTREIAPLVLSGPAGVTGYAGGKREVREIYSFWPSLIDRSLVKTSWELIDGR